jgi:hypothetical protein
MSAHADRGILSSHPPEPPFSFSEIGTKTHRMKAFSFQSRNGTLSPLSKTIAAGAASIVLLLVWLSADPEAHEHFHHDAAKGEHQCVVTEFASGEGYYMVPEIAVPPVEAVFGAAHFSAADTLREAVDYVLLPTCGPPSRALSA